MGHGIRWIAKLVRNKTAGMLRLQLLGPPYRAVHPLRGRRQHQLRPQGL